MVFNFTENLSGHLIVIVIVICVVIFLNKICAFATPFSGYFMNYSTVIRHVLKSDNITLSLLAITAYIYIFVKCT